MSELSLGQIKGLPVNSNVVTVPAGHKLYAPGHVLQVVSSSYQTLTSTTSTAFQPSGLSVTITPSNAASKVFIIATTGAYIVANDANYLTLFRDTTNLGNGTNGIAQIFAGNQPNADTATLTDLDSPNTTSAVTYTLRFRSGFGGSAQVQYSSALASITVMEIAA